MTFARINTSLEEWTPGEELRLRELAGTVQVREIARILSREFHVPRTSCAVSVRAAILGLSLWWDGYSQNQVAEIFSVWFATVARWRREGLLAGEHWEVGRGSHGQWHFSDEAISAFIDGCTWAYDSETMAPGRWRSRAEVAHRADPWLTARDVAAIWHVHPATVMTWIREGRIPHRRRAAGLGLPKVVIRAADLPGLRAELREQALTNLRAGIRRRDERRRAA